MTETLPTARGRAPMTEEETERLRASVPDDPIKPPPGTLACEACGIAVLQPKPTTTAYPESVTLTGRVQYGKPVQFSRCEGCQATRDQADAYVAAHPRLGARAGPEIARERVESVLFGLAVIAQDATGTDLTLMLPRMHPASHEVRYSHPKRDTQGRCTQRPWAHVSLTDRATLRKAYADTLRDRLALKQPPAVVRCPSGACLMCGVTSITRSAIEVTRAGSVAAVALAAWRQVWTTPAALGGRGPEQVWGHVCPACDRAIQEEGAVGWPARVQAVAAHLGSSSVTKARAFEADVLTGPQPWLPSWSVAGGGKANARPWAHLQRYLDRL